MPTHHIPNHQLNPKTYGGGGRVASDALRCAQDMSDHFGGLEEGTDRYSLLLLVKKAGKLAGFTPRSIALLDYYLAFTRDSDWEEGARPIVYQSLTKTALDLGVSERQVQKLESALFAAGAITWNDSGNHKRYGRRCPDTGRLVFAFGVDLSPLSYLRKQLEMLLEEKRRSDEAWLETKRQISWYRRQIRGLLLEAEQGGRGPLTEYDSRYDEIAVQIRTHLTIDTLRSLLNRHRSLHNELLALVGRGETAETKEASQRASIAKETPIGACRNDRKFVHYKSTNQGSSDESDTSSRNDTGFQESVADLPEHSDPASDSGLTHVSLGMAIDAAGPRFREHLPDGASWGDLVEAANRVRRSYGVSQASWAEACSVLGRNGAALCVLLVDHGANRDENRIRTPAAYFRGMIRRARAGELRLHKSVFGLLKGGSGCH
ncbi:MAG: plasmid replication protein RepC [Planctomycetota bacterium]